MAHWPREYSCRERDRARVILLLDYKLVNICSRPGACRAVAFSLRHVHIRYALGYVCARLEGDISRGFYLARDRLVKRRDNARARALWVSEDSRAPGWVAMLVCCERERIYDGDSE